SDPLVGTNYCDWLADVELDPQVKCVLVGFDPHFSYMKMLRASSYLKKPSCLFLATNPDNLMPVKHAKICIPVTGCIVSPLVVASGRQPLMLGKPAPDMFHLLRRVHGLDPSRCMMVGDRLDTDIQFARNCGMRSMLVLSGISTIEDIHCSAHTGEPTNDDIHSPAHTGEPTNDDIHSPAHTREKTHTCPDFYADSLAAFGMFIQGK
ncbi:hypothetical protein EGW08_015332, partial [Elysia chlorotica]